jgi:hypothetical protein
MVALLPEREEHDALIIAERLRQAVASHKIDNAGTSFGVTVSIGVARWQAFEPSIEAVLARADRALYRVKNSGRNGTLLNLIKSSEDRETPGARAWSFDRSVRGGTREFDNGVSEVKSPVCVIPSRSLDVRYAARPELLVIFRL